AEAFKSSIAPLIDTLEPEMIIELESLTELTLTVFQTFLCADWQNESEEMMEIEYTEPQDTNSAALDRWSSLPEELSNPSFFVSSAEHLLILEFFVDAVKTESKDNLEKLLSSSLLLRTPITLPSFFARVWMTVSYPAK